jgi:putative FmdB family regulatory protein
MAYDTIRDERELYMPIYEYWCHHCQKKVAVYLSTISNSAPLCPDCKQNELYRLFSTFSVHKTDHDIYEDILSDSNLTKGMLDNNPQALAEWNKRMSRGQKVSPEYEQTLRKLEKGEAPSQEDTRHLTTNDEKTD